MEERVLGIDLGTTNTCVAVVEDGRPVIVPNSEGSRTTPSVIAFTRDGSVLVGAAARRQAVTNPRSTVHSVKRLMGMRGDDARLTDLRRWLGYEVGPDDRGNLVLHVGSRERTPVEVSAILLKAVRRAAEEYFGEDCTSAVVTCPAYFDDAQRQATADAARIAGLDVIRMINEPTAAALAYGFGGRSGTFVVYDWGGGTFDCTVLECADGVYQVRATRGDSFLGGNDLDERLVSLMVDHFYRMHGAELGEDGVAIQRLREAAEAAKIELSSAQETEVILPFLTTEGATPRHFEMTLKRPRFEQIVDELLERTLDCCRKALDDAGITPKDVDDVLLVGGSTKIPLVQRQLEGFFGKPPRKGVHADEAVAIGAALQGQALQTDDDELLLIDVLPLSLGIAAGDTFERVLHRNVPVPTFRTQTFATTRDHQGSVLIRVYQGDHPKVADNKLIGTFRLENLPPAPAGALKIEVTFSVDSNGMLQVEARHKGTGHAQAVHVRDAIRLSDQEIARLSGDLGI